jgi:tetratricopeptide (TPR) repeat protein
MFPFFLETFGALSLIGFIFWLWMLSDCLRGGVRDRNQWVWVMLVLNVIGALLYFFICWLPQHPNFLPTPTILNRWRLRDTLWQAEADAHNIGNALQDVKLGDVLQQIGEIDKAAIAYQRALEKEPTYPKALWMLALLEFERHNLEKGKSYLQNLLKVSPEYGYGEASLYYGEILASLEDWESTKIHLQKHLKYWSHPQSYLSLAKAQQKLGEIKEARATLETMIIKIKSSTPFQFRKNRQFMGQGEKLLKTLN